MEKLLTTKDLAKAIGASESSMRRWTDSGAIRTSRTVGGHRRIPLSEAVRFIRDTQATVVRPDVLGLEMTPRSPSSALPQSADEDELFDALNDGDARRARALVVGLYLGGSGMAAIFDGPLVRAMNRVGDLWQHSAAGILVEHRASDICLQLVNELRRLLPPADRSAPAAVGGAPQGDPYVLPSLLASAVVGEAGYRDVNFGPNTPVKLLGDAAESHGARLVWLSASVLPDPVASVRRDVATLAARLRLGDGHLVLGGRHAADLVPRPAPPNLHVLNTMSELVAFTRGAKPTEGAGRGA